MKKKRAGSDYVKRETDIIERSAEGGTRVALVYPNTYPVGMSNLGFQTVYRLLVGTPGISCERAFLPEGEKPEPGSIRTVESGREVAAFDIIAFSISFESDYLNLLSVIKCGGIPLLSEDREDSHPLVLAGGVAVFLNPEPIAPFVDCFLVGEAEPLLPSFFKLYDPSGTRADELKKIAAKAPGIYVPSLYTPEYNEDHTLASFTPEPGLPRFIEKPILTNVSETATTTAILTPDTTFNDTFLMEVSRGCAHGCRFCSAGYIYRPPRFRDTESLKTCMDEGLRHTDSVGLVGAAVSDHPGINELACHVKDRDVRLSFSSLRANALTPELVGTLKKGGVKTATIAPEAGSQRMRRVINKGIDEADILSATRTLVTSGIPNLKLYFMIGLPTETMEDIEEIVSLVKKIKEVFLEESRAQKRIGTITAGINPFVPKPLTPFQWAPMEKVKTLKKKINYLTKTLKKIPNVNVSTESPRGARIQALLSRGDRRVSELLVNALENGGDWNRTLRESELDADFYVHRERGIDELFPWDFIHHGIKRSFLLKEYQKALENRSSPPCPVKDCRECGICMPLSE